MDRRLAALSVEEIQDSYGRGSTASGGVVAGLLAGPSGRSGWRVEYSMDDRFMADVSVVFRVSSGIGQKGGGNIVGK